MDWPGGSWEATLTIVAVIVGAYLVVIWLSLLIWTYLDIRSRANVPVVQVAAVVIVALFNFPGFFLYLMLRPHETLAEAYDRFLDEEALQTELSMKLACSECGAVAADDYLVCPYCSHRLREPCMSCSRPVMVAWRSCPYCAAVRPAFPKPRRRTPAFVGEAVEGRGTLGAIIAGMEHDAGSEEGPGGQAGSATGQQ